MVDRIIKGVGAIKHDKVDKIDGKRVLTIFCKFFDGDQKVVATDNLNFTLNDEKYNQLKSLLGLTEFSRKTPIRMRLEIIENDLEEWAKMASIELDEPQSTVEDPE